MRAAVRYAITVGIALGGVSVIVAAPGAPPLQDIQVPAVQLSNTMHDGPDMGNISVGDLLHVMNGFTVPDVVVQNIIESDAGSLNSDQPSNVPGLSDLLNLGGGSAGAPADQPRNPFVDIGPITPGDLSAAPGN